MTSDLSYAFEKTYIAVEILCTSKHELGERLIRAWHDSLYRLRLPDIPAADLQERFKDIADYFVLPPGGRPYPVETLIWEEQARIAGEILQLHFEIRKRKQS